MRLIDAHKLYEQYETAMREIVKITNCENICLETLILLCGANLIANAPTVDAVPMKHGRWETDSTEQNEFWGHYCNRCSTYLPYGRDWRPNYCPECGAKMDLEEQDANEET